MSDRVLLKKIKWTKSAGRGSEVVVVVVVVDALDEGGDDVGSNCNEIVLRL